MFKIAKALLALPLALSLSFAAQAQNAGTFANGDFSTTTGSSTSFRICNPATSSCANLDDWTTNNATSQFSATAPQGYLNLLLFQNNAVPAPGAAALGGGVPGIFAMPSNTDPANGNFVALDGGGSARASLSQVIYGLTPNQSYTVSFIWAGAQIKNSPLADPNGTNTNPFNVNLQVLLGDAALDATAPSLPAATQLAGSTTVQPRSATPWTPASLTFVADAATQTLSFLAGSSSPNGLPPTVLLDNITVTAAVPEPTTWALMLGGLGALGMLARRRTPRKA